MKNLITDKDTLAVKSNQLLVKQIDEFMCGVLQKNNVPCLVGDYLVEHPIIGSSFFVPKAIFEYGFQIIKPKSI